MWVKSDNKYTLTILRNIGIQHRVKHLVIDSIAKLCKYSIYGSLYISISTLQIYLNKGRWIMAG